MGKIGWPETRGLIEKWWKTGGDGERGIGGFAGEEERKPYRREGVAS